MIIRELAFLVTPLILWFAVAAPTKQRYLVFLNSRRRRTWHYWFFACAPTLAFALVVAGVAAGLYGARRGLLKAALVIATALVLWWTCPTPSPYASYLAGVESLFVADVTLATLSILAAA